MNIEAPMHIAPRRRTIGSILPLLSVALLGTGKPLPTGYGVERVTNARGSFGGSIRRSSTGRRRMKHAPDSWQHRARLAVLGGPVRGKPFRAAA